MRSFTQKLSRKTLRRRDLTFDDLPLPKKPKRWPTVLTPEEVSRLIEAASNLMHRTILMVLYETGMRRTEVSLLKVTDIDSKRSSLSDNGRARAIGTFR